MKNIFFIPSTLFLSGIVLQYITGRHLNDNEKTLFCATICFLFLLSFFFYLRKHRKEIMQTISTNNFIMSETSTLPTTSESKQGSTNSFSDEFFQNYSKDTL